MSKMKPKQNRGGDIYTPQKFDACQTPPYAVEPLLPYLRPEWTIWEPAMGGGMLYGVLAKNNTVVGSDLLFNMNFFDYEPPTWNALVTNPPFSVKYPWLRRCYALGKPFALLIPVESLGAKTAQVLMEAYSFEIMLLSDRVDFYMPNQGWNGKGAQFPVLWLCWKLLPQQVMFGHISDSKKAFKEACINSRMSELPASL